MRDRRSQEWRNSKLLRRVDAAAKVALVRILGEYKDSTYCQTVVLFFFLSVLPCLVVYLMLNEPEFTSVTVLLSNLASNAQYDLI